MKTVNRVTNRRRLGKKQQLHHAIAVFDLLRWNLATIGTNHTSRHTVQDLATHLDNVFALDVEWIVDGDRIPAGLRVHRRNDAFSRALEHTRKLVHREHIVIPRKLKCPGRRSAGQNVVKLSTHDERPGVVQAFLRVRATTQPRSADRGFLRGVGEQFVLAVPAFPIRLRSYRTCGVIREQQIALVTRQSFYLLGANVEKHLLRCRRHNLQWSITNTRNRRWAQRRVSRHDRFHHAHRVFAWRAAGVARAVIVIVGEQSTDFAIALDAARPINRRVALVCTRERGTLADVFSHLPAVAARIQSRNNTTSVWPLPPADVEWNPAWRFLNRAWATNGRRRIPGEFLCREPFQTRVRENARQRR